MCADMYFYTYMSLRGHLRAQHRYSRMLEADKHRFENIPGTIRRRQQFDPQELAKAVAATLAVMRENGDFERYVCGGPSTGVSPQVARQVQPKSGSGDFVVTVSPTKPAAVAGPISVNGGEQGKSHVFLFQHGFVVIGFQRCAVPALVHWPKCDAPFIILRTLKESPSQWPEIGDFLVVSIRPMRKLVFWPQC